MDQSTSQKKARLIAFYLPQYHPIPENDEWWGKGFTEWTNSSKARPMFCGHYQPHVPADLGYYDLRLSEPRIAQAEMAKAHGIEGFCYWHYWFGNGRRLLELPLNEVLKSGKPDFPFCIAWANQTWSGIWHGCPKRVLIEQKYPGVADYEAHFYSLIGAFSDNRYIKIDDKPVFVVYDVKNLPDPKLFAECWRKLAIRAGFKGIYLVGQMKTSWNPRECNFDANINNTFFNAVEKMESRFKIYFTQLLDKFTGINIDNAYRRIFNKPRIYSYKEFIKHAYVTLNSDIVQFPCVYPNWDNTPRSGYRGYVLKGSTPELWRLHLKNEIEQVCGRDYDKRVIFIKSWNEWAEGNYLEPDLKYGKAYLKVVKEEIMQRT